MQPPPWRNGNSFNQTYTFYNVYQQLDSSNKLPTSTNGEQPWAALLDIVTAVSFTSFAQSRRHHLFTQNFSTNYARTPSFYPILSLLGHGHAILRSSVSNQSFPCHTTKVPLKGTTKVPLKSTTKSDGAQNRGKQGKEQRNSQTRRFPPILYTCKQSIYIFK